MLLFFTTITKNSTKEIEEQIYNTKENLRILEQKYEMVLLDFHYLSSPEKLMEYQSRYFENELKAQNSAIQSLRNEIEATKKRIQSEGRKEKTSARRVSNLSEEISLLQRLLNEIDKEERLLVADVSRTEKRIEQSEIELDTLRVRYGRRLTKMYKKGQLSNLEKILSLVIIQITI